MGQYPSAAKLINRIFDADLSYACVTNLCYEALCHGFYGVQVFPNMIGLCKKVLKDSDVKIISLITYPHGTFTAPQKAFEIQDALELGADEVEVCINCLHIRSGLWDKVREEMQVCRAAAGSHVLKFILEVEYLTPEQIRQCCQIAREEKVDFLVSSTGLYNTLDENKRDVPIPVTEEDIRLLRSAAGDQMGIIAQGNVDSPAMADALLAAGADYLAVEKPMHFIF